MDRDQYDFSDDCNRRFWRAARAREAEQMLAEGDANSGFAPTQKAPTDLNKIAVKTAFIYEILLDDVAN